MRLPARFPAFKEPVLIACLARHSAKPYIIEEETISELPVIQTAETEFHYTDREGFQPTRQANGVAFRPGTSEHNKEHYDQVFVNYFISELTSLDQKSPFAEITLFVPKTLKGLVSAKLTNGLKAKTQIIPGSFFKQDPLSLLEKMKAEKPAVRSF